MTRFQCCLCGTSINEKTSECLPLQIFIEADQTQSLFAHAFCLRRHLHHSVPLRLKSETEIYVFLVNEGTEVWRPARAIPLNDEIFLLSPDQKIPVDEDWQFVPGQVVYCKQQQLSECQLALVAVGLCEDV